MRRFCFLLWGISLIALVACASSKPTTNVKERSDEVFSSAFFQETPQKTEEPELKYDFQEPVIMVIPAISNNASAIEVIKQNPFAKTTMESINEYLTEKSYKVRSLEGNEDLTEVLQIQNDISDKEEDMSYIAGLTFGADIYITFSGSIRNDMVTVELSAYETTTARLLGSKTGMVKDHGTDKSNQRYLIQTAVKKALPALEKTIHAYWQEDSKKGIPYKVIINLGERFSGEILEDIQDQCLTSIRANFSNLKINQMTEKTIDLVLYAKATEFPDVYAVYSAIKASLSDKGVVQKNNITNKLIIMELN
jgi:hypothetical protein